jgi:integrase
VNWKLTKAGLDAVEADFRKSDKADKIYFDEDLPGFGIRLRAAVEDNQRVISKKKVWVVRYEYAGIQRKLALGTLAVIPDPGDAREMARKAMAAKTWLGVDPAQMKAEEKAKARLTLRSIANQYLQRQQKQLRPKSFKEAQRYLLKSFRSLHGLPIHKITRRDIAVVINDLAEKTPVAASAARSVLSALFTWAKGEGLMEGDNPAEGTNAPVTAGPRVRVLMDSELCAIWNACEGTYGNIVKLLILTGQRREEVGGMRQSELNDPDPGVWTMPASRTKNKREHSLPLSKMAWDIIDAVSRRESSDHLFGGGINGFTDWSKQKRRLDQHAVIAEDWHLHDLRRTVATRMADLGILPHVIEAVLNHVSGHKAGVAGVYNRSAYTQQMKSALAIWADRVAVITSGAERKIVQFPAS